MPRLPPVLARDYRRRVLWPKIGLCCSFAVIAAIILGVMR